MGRGPELNTRRDILDELSVSRKVVRSGEEMMPRFYVYSPTGIYLVVIPLPKDADMRRECFWRARLFMIWKAATGFILSGELKTPDAISATLVTRDEVTGASQLVTHTPLKFAEPVWYGREDVEEEIIDILPAKSVQLTADEMLIIGEFENGTVSELTWFRPEDLD
jgi:hypothetical protein